MRKPSKRRRQKTHGKAQKTSKHDQRPSKSPVTKEHKKKRGKSASRSPSVETDRGPRGSSGKRRRNDWTRRMNDKGKKRDYTKQEWYWGLISQAEAEEFLKDGANGEFLVRGEVFQGTTAVIITLVSVADKEKKFHHLHVSAESGKWQLENYPSRHGNVIKVVEHYHYNFIGMTGMKLKHASKQPDWFIKSYHIMSPRNSIVLGAGNFSAVVVGAFRRRLVAVKLLTSMGDQLQVDRESLMKEAILMNKLQHPYITKMVGVSIDQLPPKLLVEMMATSLISHIERYGKYTTIGEKLLYCWQLANGLAFMAKQGIVHRDIAARNALFSRYGILKLSDFGLSDFEMKLMVVNAFKDQLPVKWMPPESLGGSKASTFNEKTDVWMFGVTCNEIFHNGIPPLEDLPAVPKLDVIIRKYKDGDTLHVLPKFFPRDIQDYFKKIWMQKNSDRPNFAEILAVFDLWLSLKYPPPPIEKRTVQMITNCRPLTNAEYEILYQNNWDWLPAVRKVKMKKAEKKKKSTMKSESKSKKKPEKVLKDLKRKLMKERKRRRLRMKLRWWRERRREEKRRIKVLISYETKYPKKVDERTNGYKKIREKYEKLVQMYWKLMMVKWRKRAPNRQTRLRLRRHRLINRRSKHPASRNRKLIPYPRKTEMRRQKHDKFSRPKMPKITKFAVKKKRNIKKTKDSVSGKNKSIGRTPKKVSSEKCDPMKLEKLKERKERKIRKLKRHWLRKQIKRKYRKKHRGIRRQRRRQKLRRRYRKKKMMLRRRALTVDQKEKMRLLKKRRRQKKRKLNRLKRSERVGKILLEWRTVRRILLKRRAKRMLKRKIKKEGKNKKKDAKSKLNTARSGRKTSRKSRTRT